MCRCQYSSKAGILVIHYIHLIWINPRFKGWKKSGNVAAILTVRVSVTSFKLKIIIIKKRQDLELGWKISCHGLGEVNLVQIQMLGWIYLRTDEQRTFALLDSRSHELPHSYAVLHFLGLAVCSWQRDYCWSREEGEKVVVAVVGILTVRQLQFLVLTIKAPVHHWHFSPCSLHLPVFPQHGSVSLCLLALILSSRQSQEHFDFASLQNPRSLVILVSTIYVQKHSL